MGCMVEGGPGAEHLSFSGKVCWKAAAEGPCLASTTVTSAGLNHKGSWGQASFDYAAILTPGTQFSAVAAYEGSLLCKKAPSNNVNQPPPSGVIMVGLLSSCEIQQSESGAARR